MNINPTSTAEIRFSDCDPFGHLNNARFLDYFLHAREQHLKQAYGMELKAFYEAGVSWFIGSHEIVYLKPAYYNETVHIQSTLLKVAEDHLIAEMFMTNESRSHVKAVVWTKFIPVNVKTGKKELHPPSVMEFVKSIENSEAGSAKNIQERISTILAELQGRNVK